MVPRWVSKSLTAELLHCFHVFSILFPCAFDARQKYQHYLSLFLIIYLIKNECRPKDGWTRQPFVRSQPFSRLQAPALAMNTTTTRRTRTRCALQKEWHTVTVRFQGFPGYYSSHGGSDKDEQGRLSKRPTYYHLFTSRESAHLAPHWSIFPSSAIQRKTPATRP